MMTKKERAMLSAYRGATATELYHVYDSCSKAKRDAFEQCRAIQCDWNGYDGKIVSANTWQFTYAFRYKTADGNEWLHYETANNTYDFPIEEE